MSRYKVSSDVGCVGVVAFLFLGLLSIVLTALIVVATGFLFALGFGFAIHVFPHLLTGGFLG